MILSTLFLGSFTKYKFNSLLFTPVSFSRQFNITVNTQKKETSLLKKKYSVWFGFRRRSLSPVSEKI